MGKKYPRPNQYVRTRTGTGVHAAGRIDDKLHTAAIAVFERAQKTGEQVTIALCRDVVSEIGSAAKPERVLPVVLQWQREIASTRHRGGRR